MTIEQMMSAIRANLAGGVAAGQGLSAPERGGESARTDADLGALAASGDLVDVPLGSSRRLGPIIEGARRMLTRVLGPVLARQSSYNAINARIIAGLRQELERAKARVAALEAQAERRPAARDDEP